MNAGAARRRPRRPVSVSRSAGHHSAIISAGDGVARVERRWAMPPLPGPVRAGRSGERCPDGLDRESPTALVTRPGLTSDRPAHIRRPCLPPPGRVDWRGSGCVRCARGAPRTPAALAGGAT